jgi:hypothetical protein
MIIIKQSGVKELFNGLGATIFRAFFVNAILFYINEFCHYELDNIFHNKHTHNDNVIEDVRL